MSGPARLVGLTAFIGSSTGCTSWSRIPDSRPVPSRGTVQIWSGAKDILLRDPRRLGDSLVGEGPFEDTTRRAVALSDIDSLRAQDLDLGKVLIVGTGMGMAVLYLFAKGLEGS